MDRGRGMVLLAAALVLGAGAFACGSSPVIPPADDMKIGGDSATLDAPSAGLELGTDDLVGTKCSQVYNCQTDLCAYGGGKECPRGACVFDRFELQPEFYCSRPCDEKPCPAGFTCAAVELRGTAAGRYCVRYRPACGNGVLDPGEVCDDGNTKSSDGCSQDCASKEVCGNGVVDESRGEMCDDGNTKGGDGCSADCKSDERCPNGLVDPGEQCDDGNFVDGDGCDAGCLLSGCGNGKLVDPEACDDGNTLGGDGCDSACRITPVSGVSRLDAFSPEDSSSSHNVQIAPLQQGQVFVSWLEEPFLTIPAGAWRGLFTGDGGDHWSDPVELFTTWAGTQLLPISPSELLMIRNGSGSATLEVRESTTGGRTWSAVRTTKSTKCDEGHFHAAYAGGKLHVACLEWDGKVHRAWYLTSADRGKTWSTPMEVSDAASRFSGGCDHVSLFVASATNFLVTFCAYGRTTRDGGATFQPSPLEVLDARRIGLFPDGTLFAYSETSFFRSSDQGSTWSNIVLDTTPPALLTGAAVAAAGGSSVIWARLRQADAGGQTKYELVVRRSSDLGATWQPAQVLLSDTLKAYGVGITSTSKGVFLWWLQCTSSVFCEYKLKVRQSTDAGLTFGPVQLPNVAPKRFDTWGRVVEGGDGTVHVFWTDTAKPATALGDLKHRRL